MHAVMPLTQMAIIVMCALVCGLIFSRLRQPPILGYVLAGVLLGPRLLGDMNHIYPILRSLSDLGVFMLLFVLGMGMNLRFFRDTWMVTLGCVLLQIGISLSAIYCLSFFFAWSTGLIIVLGCIISLSSTAVAIKMLESMGEMRTNTGHLTIGILIAQDLAFVPMVLLIQGMGAGDISYTVIGAKVIGSVGLLALLIWSLIHGERVKIPYLGDISRNGELLPLLALTFCFGLAALTGMIGLSAAYGAFLAGLILGNTAERREIIEVTNPIQNILLMVFFLSIGLMIDIDFIIEHIVMLSFLLLVVLLGKTALNAVVLHFFKRPWSTSFISSLVLAQIGELAFVLSDAAESASILTHYDHKLIISLIVLTLMFSPFWMSAARKFQMADGNLSPSLRQRLKALWPMKRGCAA